MTHDVVVKIEAAGICVEGVITEDEDLSRLCIGLPFPFACQVYSQLYQAIHVDAIPELRYIIDPDQADRSTVLDV